MKWKEESGILCGKKIIVMRMKGKFYKSVMRSTMLYKLECRVVDKRIEQSMSAAEMRML